ncbi:MAG TPA: hypothetical protein IAB98_04125 [Candidatus Egerieimonas intestinavium]|uniref:Lipocalin-like domain-containing protein n=1 Tax=Candidatus Egerieimonas intestinavium TaxID=2840777 RepID=A0A9D1JFD2_9FIRM|nr:hypothetical protein [Candidatus Egerieimonas intestinavium]
MKRTLATVLALLLLGILALTGCGKDEKEEILGTWNATKVKVEDTEVEMSAFLEELGEPTMRMKLTFSEDGTAKCNLMGEKTEGLWEVNEDGTYTLSDENGEMLISIENEQLILDYAEIQFVFEKAQ